VVASGWHGPVRRVGRAGRGYVNFQLVQDDTAGTADGCGKNFERLSRRQCRPYGLFRRQRRPPTPSGGWWRPSSSRVVLSAASQADQRSRPPSNRSSRCARRPARYRRCHPLPHRRAGRPRLRHRRTRAWAASSSS